MFNGKWLKKIKRIAIHKCDLPNIDRYDEGSAWLCRKCRKVFIVKATRFFTTGGETIDKYKWIRYEDKF